MTTPTSTLTPETKQKPTTIPPEAATKTERADLGKLGTQLEIKVLKDSLSGESLKEVLEKFGNLPEETQIQVGTIFNRMQEGLLDSEFLYEDFLDLWGAVFELEGLDTTKFLGKLKADIPEPKFEEAKVQAQNLKTERERRAKMFRETHPDYMKLDPRQISFLGASPEINISNLVDEAKRGTSDAKEQLKNFKKLYVDAVYSKAVVPYVAKARQVTTKSQGSALQLAEMALVEKNSSKPKEGENSPKTDEIKFTTLSGVGKFGGLVAGGMGSLFGNFTGYPLASEDPVLKKIFDSVESLGILNVEVTTGGNEAKIKMVIGAQFDKIFGNLENKNKTEAEVLLENIKTTFTSFDIEAIEDGKKEQKQNIEFVLLKLKTVPKGWRDSDWVGKYEDYIMETGRGSMDFEEWIGTQKVGFFEKIWAWIKTMFGDVLDWFKTDEEKNKGTKLGTLEEKYKEHLKTARGDKDKVDETTPEGEKLGKDGKSAFRALEKIATEAKVELDIQIGGKKISDTKDLSKEQTEQLVKVAKFFKETPNAKTLLSKGLELEDLYFLATHKGDDSPDGLNVYFEEGKLKIAADAGAIINYTLGRTVDTASSTTKEIILSGATIGAGFGVWAGFPGIIVGAVLGIVGATIGAGLAYVGKECDLSYGEIDYNNPDFKNKLHTSIEDIQGKLEKAKEDVTNYLNTLKKSTENPEGLSDNDLSAILKSAEFSELQTDLAGFWGGYRPTVADIKNFLKYKGKDTDKGFDEWSWLDVFHEEEISSGEKYIGEDGEEKVSDRSMTIFEVDGTGSYWPWEKGDYRFLNVKSFFAWLAKGSEAEKPKDAGTPPSAP